MNQQSITAILQNSDVLSRFVRKLKKLEELDALLRSHLDPDLAPHCSVANLRDGVLILATTDPVWKHKLRFAKVELLSQLRKTAVGSELASIEIIVQPPRQEGLEILKKEKCSQIPQAVAEELLLLADTLDNPHLKAAVQKLAGSQETGG